MYRVYLLLLAVLTASSFMTAQSVFNLLQVKSVSVSMSAEQDIVNGLSGEQFMDRVRGNANFVYPEMGFDKQDVVSMQCENPNYRVNVGFAPTRWTNGMFTVGVNTIIDRVEAVSYSKGSSYLHMHTWSDEIGLELKYSHKAMLGPLGLTGAVGTNVGFAFGNEMQVTGQNITAMLNDGDEIPRFYPDFDDSYQLRNDVYTRVFLELGPSVTIARRFELGLFYRKGFGMRATTDSQATNSLSHDAFALSFSWLLRNR